MQVRLLSRLPDEITAEVESELKQMIEQIASGNINGRSKGKDGGHGHDGLSEEAFRSTERIDLGSSVNYIDGTYEGSADAYAPELF